MGYIDPTGHKVEEDVYNSGRSCDQKLKKSKPPCAKRPSRDARMDLDNLPLSTDDYLNTYTVANIALQKGPRAPWVQKAAIKLKGKYASEGPAKVTDAEMETPYGDPINGGNNNYGLGLRTPGATTPDQNDMVVAITAMSTRIQVRLDKCNKTKFGCTPTDIFITAAFGGDNGIAPGDLRDLGNGGVYGEPDPITGIFPWEEYLSGVENKSHNKSVLRQFINNVAYLQDKGAAVPDVDWTYLCDLAK